MNRSTGRSWVVWFWLGAAMVVLGCGGDPTGEEPPSAVAVFDLPAEGPVPFLAVPFPADVYLDGAGKVQIGGMDEAAPFVANVRLELSRRSGFCRICAITFPVSGVLDPASVTGDAMAHEGASLDDPVVLMRADGEGGPIPLQVDYHADQGFVVMRPAYGVVLQPGTRYVAALTSRVLASDGTPIGAASLFRDLRDGAAVDAVDARARPMVVEALDAFEEAGLDRDAIVSATAFGTEEGVGLLREVGDIAEAAPVPVVSVDRLWTAEELDDLLGVPSEDRPGMDIPPEDGVGSMSIVHDAMEFVVAGTFTSPRIVGGEGSDIGLLRRDADGAVVPGPTSESIPWVLVVPKDVDLVELPVVLAHHGNPANKRFALRVGNTFARMGMAVFGYDGFQMGGRAASADDQINELRGLDVPDGLAEHDDQDVLMRQLGIVGAAPGEEDRPDHLLAFNAQMALDVVMAVRLLREGDLTEVASTDAGLDGLSFDPTQVYYVGQSFGGYMGMTALPLLAGQVQAMVPMVGPPDTTENICNSPGNRPTFDLLGPGLLGISGPFEEAGRRLCMTPEVDLLRWLIEPFSPVHTLHHALREPLMEQAPPDLLFYYAEYDELLGSSSGEHVLGVAGVPTHGQTFFVEPPPLGAPLSSNFETPAGAITAAGWVWSSDHSLIRAKHAEIGWETPYYPPFTPLSTPQAHINPIEDAHAQVQHFFDSRRATGSAELADPSAL